MHTRSVLLVGAFAVVVGFSSGPAAHGDNGGHEHDADHEDEALDDIPEGTEGTINVDWIAGFSSSSTPVVTGLHVGDELVFYWGAGEHSVYVMADEHAFEHCDFSGAVLLGEASGTKYEWKSNDHMVYFACGVEGHCPAGQKLKASS